MPRVLYVMKYPTCMQTTLKNKFDGQLSAFRELGFDADYLEWDGKYITLATAGTDERVPIMSTTCSSIESYFHHQYLSDVCKAASRAVAQRHYDLVYIRKMPWLPASRTLARSIPSDTTCIIEIPSYPEDSERTRFGKKRRLELATTDIIGKPIMRRADCIAAIGINPPSTIYCRPAVRLLNGVDVNIYPRRLPTQSADGSIHVMLLACMSYWQGYDRAITGLSQYVGPNQIYLHFVGNDGDGSLAEWQKLSVELGLENKVIFHGYLHGSELSDLVNHMDCGLGSLGLYRKGISDTCALKVAEYMARGLPFLYTGNEVKLNPSLPYVRQVTNDSSPLAMEDIVSLVERTRLDTDTPDKMRSYAQSNMTWAYEMRHMIEAASNKCGSKLL